MNERDLRALEELLKRADGPMTTAEARLVRRAVRELTARGMIGRPSAKLAEIRRSARNAEDLDCVEFGVIDGLGELLK